VGKKPDRCGKRGIQLIEFKYTDSPMTDSITRKPEQGGLIIQSDSRVYFLSTNFIEWAHKIITERKVGNGGKKE
jgi:hypothetical protein